MTLRNLIALIAFCLVALALASCGGEEGPPTAGEAKDFTTVCDKANEGKRVALEGYLRFPESFSGESMVLRFYQANDLKGAPIGVQMRVGSQANHVEQVPKQYSDKDLKVHLANGQVVGIGTKVRVSGTVYFPLVGQDFACALSNPLVEPAN